MTVGELKQRLAGLPDDRPIVLLFASDDDYMKAYATRVESLHDFLPDGEGGDDIHNAGFIVVIEARPEKVE